MELGTEGKSLIPVEVTGLAEQLPTEKQKDIQRIFNLVFDGTEEMRLAVSELVVKDENDTENISKAESFRKEAKAKKVASKKLFDECRSIVQSKKAEFDLEDKLYLKCQQTADLILKSIEQMAEEKANTPVRIAMERHAAMVKERSIKVSEYQEPRESDFANMSEDVFNNYLSGLKATYIAKIEAERKAEADRVAKEKADAEAIEQQRLENERLKAEAEKREKEIQAERKANELKLAKEKAEAEAETARLNEIKQKRSKELQPYIVFIRDYNSLINKSESEYQAEFSDIKKGAYEQWEYEASERIKLQEKEATERAEKEALAKANAEREAKLKALELANQKTIEEKKKEEDKAKKEADRLLKAPIKKQIKILIDNLVFPDSKINHETLTEIKDKFESFKRWANDKVDQI